MHTHDLDVTQMNIFWPLIVFYTKPKFLVFMANRSLDFKMAFDVYSGMYKREIQVFAVGKCWSSAGRIVMLGIG